MTHPNHQRIISALTSDPTPLIQWAARAIVALGAKSEWSMDDNLTTTEGLAELAAREYGLPSGQGAGPLAFYGRAAEELGFENEMDELLDTWRNAAMDGDTTLGFDAWLDRKEEEGDG